MEVIIQKADLDTCLTAFVMGVSASDDVTIRRIRSHDAIHRPDVLCIEAGGSGLVHLNNFDHHDPDRYFPPACRQAYDYRGVKDAKLERLVEYVCMVDDRPKEHPVIQFPSLSGIFSGMLFVERDTIGQFIKGLEILKIVLDNDIDPFGTMPDIVEWESYRKAKEENNRQLEEILKTAAFYVSKAGLKIGYVESDVIGGIGFLYEKGCRVVVMYNSSFGTPPVRKFTIAGNNTKVSHLLKLFDAIEQGWGGRETIIGSPRQGTLLSSEQILKIVRNNL